MQKDDYNILQLLGKIVINYNWITYNLLLLTAVSFLPQWPWTMTCCTQTYSQVPQRSHRSSGRQTNLATANWATHFGQLGDRSRNKSV